MLYLVKRCSYILLVPLLLTGLLGCNDESDKAPSPVDSNAPEIKNVILMISDGASDGTWDISSYWTHGQALNDVEPYNRFPVRLAMTTYALWQKNSPVDCTQTRQQKDAYDAASAWDETPLNVDEAAEYAKPFAGYRYLGDRYTDSAASGTAMATGEKTYLGALGVNYCGEPLKNLTTIAKENDWATGLVTSVPFSHATPASFGAHNISRSNYVDIAHEMLTSGDIDILVGAGHPYYTNDNEKRDSASFTYISKADFERAQNGDLTSKKHNRPWKLIDEKVEFANLAANTASDTLLARPVLGLVQVSSTLQTRRKCSQGSTTAYSCPFNAEIPALSILAEGALNYLAHKGGKSFLMIEGGAVDWAAHANNTTGLIEEQVSFNQSVGAVMNWIDQYSNWDESILIVTTDHGNAFVLGNQSDQIPFARVANPGKDVMPRVKYYSDNHTNELVRVYAIGQGSSLFTNYIDGTDLNYAEHYNHAGASGEYIDNTAIFHVLNEIISEGGP